MPELLAAPEICGEPAEHGRVQKAPEALRFAHGPMSILLAGATPGAGRFAERCRGLPAALLLPGMVPAPAQTQNNHRIEKQGMQPALNVLQDPNGQPREPEGCRR